MILEIARNCFSIFQLIINRYNSRVLNHVKRGNPFLIQFGINQDDTKYQKGAITQLMLITDDGTLIWNWESRSKKFFKDNYDNGEMIGYAYPNISLPMQDLTLTGSASLCANKGCSEKTFVIKLNHRVRRKLYSETFAQMMSI